MWGSMHTAFSKIMLAYRLLKEKPLLRCVRCMYKVQCIQDCCFGLRGLGEVRMGIRKQTNLIRLKQVEEL